MEFLGFMTFEGHFGNCNFGMPSQSLVFPINDINKYNWQWSFLVS